MNLPKLDLHPLQRRALINGAIASIVTLLLGLGVVAAFGGDAEEPVAAPTPSPSPTPSQPACIPTWEVVQTADPGTEQNTLEDITVLSAGEAWAVGSSG